MKKISISDIVNSGHDIRIFPKKSQIDVVQNNAEIKIVEPNTQTENLECSLTNMLIDEVVNIVDTLVESCVENKEDSIALFDTPKTSLTPEVTTEITSVENEDTKYQALINKINSKTLLNKDLKSLNITQLYQLCKHYNISCDSKRPMLEKQLMAKVKSDT